MSAHCQQIGRFRGQPPGGGKPSIDGTRAEPSIKRPTLAEAGIDKKLSSHAQKVAAIPEPEFEGIVGEWRESLETANERVTTNIIKAAEKAHNHRAQGTGQNEWYTPDEYLEAAREVMGGITLDPASSDLAQEKIQAESYFTADDDGLTKDWRGNKKVLSQNDNTFTEPKHNRFITE